MSSAQINGFRTECPKQAEEVVKYEETCCCINSFSLFMEFADNKKKLLYVLMFIIIKFMCSSLDELTTQN